MAGQIDMNGPWGIGARALGFVPGPVGLLGTIGSMGMRANNIGYANTARRSWGQDGLGFGQTIGGLLGFNSYGQGGDTDKLGEFRGTPVAPGGMVREGGFLGFGTTPAGAYTPGEAQRRNAAALYGNSFGTPQVGAAPQPGVPAQARPAGIPMQSRDAFDMGRFNGDPDPIGAAIRSMGMSANGGGRSGGNGGGGARSGGGGGGRSDRSSMSSGRG
jgi:hypothetical protein